MHAIHARPSSRLVLNTLQKRSAEPALLAHCVEHMREETRSLEYTLGVLATLRGAVGREVERLRGELEGEGRTGARNEKLEKVLAALGTVDKVPAGPTSA